MAEIEELAEILPTEEQVENIEEDEEIEILEEKSTMIAEQINPNLVVNAFVNNLEDLGTEQIKTVMRAIATRKKEAITEAAIGLAYDEDKAIKVIRVVAKNILMLYNRRSRYF